MLLLVSADYVASDYLYEVEATAALARDHGGNARVIPVLLHDCDPAGEIAAFKGLAPLPSNRVPVSSWPNPHEAWAAVARGIRKAIVGPAAPVVVPEPAYESAEIRALVEQIDRARLRESVLAGMGVSTEGIKGEISSRCAGVCAKGASSARATRLGTGATRSSRLLGHGSFGAVWEATTSCGASR